MSHLPKNQEDVMNKKITGALPSKTLAKIQSKFTAVMEKFGDSPQGVVRQRADSSGNPLGSNIFITQEPDNSGYFIFLVIFMLLVLFYGFKSIDKLCPGGWDGNGVKWILLLLLFLTGGNIGMVYIFMAYIFGVRLC